MGCGNTKNLQVPLKTGEENELNDNDEEGSLKRNSQTIGDDASDGEENEDDSSTKKKKVKKMNENQDDDSWDLEGDPANPKKSLAKKLKEKLGNQMNNFKEKPANQKDVIKVLIANKLGILETTDLEKKLTEIQKKPGVIKKENVAQKRPRCFNKDKAVQLFGTYYGQMVKNSRSGEGIFVW